MSLKQQFQRIDIRDAYTCKIVDGLIELMDVLYSPPPGGSRFGEGDVVKATKMPDSLLFNGKKCIMVRSERWSQI